MTPAVVLFVLLTISALVLAAWMAVEVVLLLERRRPITWYSRDIINRYPMAAMVVVFCFVFVVGVAVTHFYLDSACQPRGS